MKHICKRIVSLALTAVLLAAVLVPALQPRVQALRYSGSASYMSGRYYRALAQVSLTGDAATDLVNVALSQVGYQEGGSKNQLSGEVYGGVNFTEYGRWYGLQDMWCAMFVSWCANVAGISTDLIPAHSYTPTGLQWFRDRGLAHSREQVAAGEYTPKAGDLIYFKSPRNKNTTNHVGIVTGYENGTIYTVEGNIGGFGSLTNGGAVTRLSYPISNTYVVYICSPAYQGSGMNASANALPEAVCAAETGAVYDSLTTCGRAIAVGCGQWYGSEAQKLLLQIRKADPEGFAKLDTADIAADLDTLDWNSYLIAEDSEKAQCIRAVLASEAGIQVQKQRMKDQLADYAAEAEAMGVTDPRAQLLCAGLRHLGGLKLLRQLLYSVEGELNAENIAAACEQEGFEALRTAGRLIAEAI